MRDERQPLVRRSEVREAASFAGVRAMRQPLAQVPLGLRARFSQQGRRCRVQRLVQSLGFEKSHLLRVLLEPQAAPSPRGAAQDLVHGVGSEIPEAGWGREALARRASRPSTQSWEPGARSSGKSWAPTPRERGAGL